MLKSTNPRGNNIFTQTLDKSSTYDTKSVLFHQGYSLDETTIIIYKGPTQPIQESIPVITGIHPTTKVEHPFDVEENSLRKYPVNFIGCYFCGYKDH